MEIDRDESVRGYEITDLNGDESEVIYCQESYTLYNPLYITGFGKRLFIVLSMVDADGKRKNRLLLNDKLLRRLSIRMG